jgi:hypothetical protein
MGFPQALIWPMGCKVCKPCHNKNVAISNSFSYAFGPIVALVGIGAMVLVLRWAYSRGSSVVAAPGKSGPSDSYGLLVCVASATNYAEGEMIRRALEDRGIKANLAQTTDGPQIMVWPKDEGRARDALRQ